MSYRHHSSAASTRSKSSSPNQSAKKKKEQQLSRPSDSSDDDEEEPSEGEEASSTSRAVVRMIDFAHSTFEGFMDDPVLHSGPDSGYLKGLDTLVDTFDAALSSNAN